MLTQIIDADVHQLHGIERAASIEGIGGSVGVIILLAILVGLSVAIYLRSRATKVDHNNVNDEWTGGAPFEPEPAAAA
jgi:PiT family inorganic phosphate transporter